MTEEFTTPQLVHAELRMLREQVKLFRQRVPMLQELVAEALAALDHAAFSIFDEEVKKNALQDQHRIRRALEQDERRFSSLDQEPST